MRGSHLSAATSGLSIAVAKRKTLFDDRPVEISVRPKASDVLATELTRGMTSAGAHLYYKTRHCTYKQVYRGIASVCQGKERVVIGGIEASRRAQQQCSYAIAEQACEHKHGIQRRA